MTKCIVCNKFKATEVCDKCGDPLCDKCTIRVGDLVVCEMCAWFYKLEDNDEQNTGQ